MLKILLFISGVYVNLLHIFTQMRLVLDILYKCAVEVSCSLF